MPLYIGCREKLHKVLLRPRLPGQPPPFPPTFNGAINGRNTRHLWPFEHRWRKRLWIFAHLKTIDKNELLPAPLIAYFSRIELPLGTLYSTTKPTIRQAAQIASRRPRHLLLVVEPEFWLQFLFNLGRDSIMKPKGS